MVNGPNRGFLFQLPIATQIDTLQTGPRGYYANIRGMLDYANIRGRLEQDAELPIAVD
jgi:hypothetical protein